MYIEAIKCDECKKINPSWHYASEFNSSKFCDKCGSYCRTVYLTEEEYEKYLKGE